jgi:hypothetical protein
LEDSLSKQFVRPHLQKMTRIKWTGGAAQAVECLLCKCETEFKLQPHQQNKTKTTNYYATVYNQKE